MSIDEKAVNEYLNQTKFIVLVSVKEGGIPAVRTLGSFAAAGLTTYFSTGRDTAKVKQIELNSTVNILFQHENQDLASFVNVSITGAANLLESPEEIAEAIEKIGERNPRFKERIAKGEAGDRVFYRVNPIEVKVVDFSKGAGANAVQVWTASQIAS